MVGNSENGLSPLGQFYLLLPILVSSATLLQLPAASSYLLNQWRAIQLYDAQEVNQEEKEKWEAEHKQSKLKSFFSFISSMLLLVGPEIFLFATVDMKLCPTLTFMRDHVVHYYMCLAGVILVNRFSSQQHFVGRSEPKRNSVPLVHAVFNFKSQSLTSRRLRLALPLALFVFLTFYLPVETLVVPSLIAVLLSGMIIRQPVSFRKFSSFRGLFLGPIIYLMFCASVGASIVAIINLMEKKGQTIESPGTERWAEALDTDESAKDLTRAVVPYVWIFCNFIPAALINLAYRYDSVNAGYALAPAGASQAAGALKDENTEVTKTEDVSGAVYTAVVLEKFDGQGKRPVLLSSVSLPRLSRRETPIFNVGMWTFLATHVGSVLLSLLLSTEALGIPRSALKGSSHSPSRIALESLFSAFPPGWPSTLLVPIAMLIRASFTKEGAAKLWSYHEKWGVDTPKQAEKVKEKASQIEEGQSLLADFE